VVRKVVAGGPALVRKLWLSVRQTIFGNS